MLEAELHCFVEGVSAFVEESPAGNGGQSAAGLIEEALYVPDYLPQTKGFFLTSSGHIWLQSHEQQDTLSVWYSLERGHSESPSRRVLGPDWFQALDATDTHVWGDLEGRDGHQLRGGPEAGAAFVTRLHRFYPLTPYVRRATIKAL